MAESNTGGTPYEGIQGQITRINNLISMSYDVVRNRGGNIPTIQNLASLDSAISSIPVNPSADATATASDILSGKTAYAQGVKLTGTIATKSADNLSANGATVSVPAGYYPSNVSKSVETATQATPSISVNSSGLITASATQTAGYVTAGTKSATNQLSTQAAATITPGTTAKTAVASGKYTTGAVQVAGDANLVAGNIKDGVSIFGVTGTYQGAATGLVPATITFTYNTINFIDISYYDLERDTFYTNRNLRISTGTTIKTVVGAPFKVDVYNVLSATGMQYISWGNSGSSSTTEEWTFIITAPTATMELTSGGSSTS